jgi:hypothetical protein
VRCATVIDASPARQTPTQSPHLSGQ